jgi:uncharacterized protein YigA (DUF484 family)
LTAKLKSEPIISTPHMNADDVAQYLKTHPDFFERYADMVADMHIPHPHGGRTIPLSERQLLTLRERGKQLEGKLREMIQFGEDNDAVSDKIHRLTVALLGTRDLAGVVKGVEFSLREDFAVPHAVLRVWRGHSELSVHEAVSEPTRIYAAGLAQPACGSQPAVDTALLFGEAAASLKSFAYVPLRDTEVFGLLAMASDDAHRFSPDMGTLFLTRLSDIISAAAARLL